MCLQLLMNVLLALGVKINKLLIVVSRKKQSIHTFVYFILFSLCSLKRNRQIILYEGPHFLIKHLNMSLFVPYPWNCWNKTKALGIEVVLHQSITLYFLVLIEILFIFVVTLFRFILFFLASLFTTEAPLVLPSVRNALGRQRSKGIRQWPTNCRLQYFVVETYKTQFYKATNQNILKVPKVDKPSIKKTLLLNIGGLCNIQPIVPSLSGEMWFLLARLLKR